MQAEERAWEVLAGLDPRGVAERALSGLTADGGAYVVPFFGSTVTVDPRQRLLTAASADGEWILGKLAYFARLCVLHYLAGAQAVPLAGRLVRSSDLKVIPTFFEGAHTLPFGALAAQYSGDTERFLQQGRRFGGKPQPYGDASVQLVPFPRLPVTLVLWKADDEFSARADLLFDATCEQHVPADILWSIAVVCVRIMMMSR